jgi:hypothetical protein
VGPSDGSEGVWESESDEEMLDRDEELAVMLEPTLGHIVLALGAVSVLAGVVGVVMFLARFAEIEMAAHG